MNRRYVVLALLVVLAATAAFAHEGHKHTSIMGTVTMVHESSLMLKTSDGKDATVVLNDQTKFTKSDKVAKKSDLAAGVRVVVVLDEDGKTAESVKIGTVAPK